VVAVSVQPDTGTGAQASAPPVLVPLAVSRAKVRRQVETFTTNIARYRPRGIELLDHRDLHVDVGFQCRLPLGADGSSFVAMPLATRLDFTNYDVWAPSVTFIDPITREALPHPPAIQGLAYRQDGAPVLGGPLNIFLDRHPETKTTFVCKRGVREYHTHFEHNGDDWLLYRGSDLGTLAQLVEMLWRHTTRTVTGLNFISQRAQVGPLMVGGYAVELRRDDVDALAEQLTPQIAQAELAMQQAAQAQQQASQHPSMGGPPLSPEQ
jgi:hypothetical protein